jgi:hypothetical protein
MGWHDVRIHAMAYVVHESDFIYELVLDIDYIHKWVCPETEGAACQFWISPATLVFEGAHTVEMDTAGNTLGIVILELKREQTPSNRSADVPRDFVWTLDCVEGSIRFHASGYKQYCRKQPQLLPQQSLDLKLRGLSFARVRTDL